MKPQQFTAYAFNAKSFIRLINDLSHALAVEHREVLARVRVNCVELSRGEKLAVINYSLPMAADLDPEVRAGGGVGLFRNVENERFPWPSQLTLSVASHRQDAFFGSIH